IPSARAPDARCPWPSRRADMTPPPSDQVPDLHLLVAGRDLNPRPLVYERRRQRSTLRGTGWPIAGGPRRARAMGHDALTCAPGSQGLHPSRWRICNARVTCMSGNVVPLDRGPEEDTGLLWRALADPTRRRILDLLRERPRVTGEIAAQFPISRIA